MVETREAERGGLLLSVGTRTVVLCYVPEHPPWSFCYASGHAQWPFCYASEHAQLSFCYA